MTHFAARFAPALLIATFFATGCNQAELDGVDLNNLSDSDSDGETGEYDSESGEDEGNGYGSDTGLTTPEEKLPQCGDGVLDMDEECDEGEDNGDSNACTLHCQINVCGDGLVYEGVEECDEGESNKEGATCLPDCTLYKPV